MRKESILTLTRTCVINLCKYCGQTRIMRGLGLTFSIQEYAGQPMFFDVANVLPPTYVRKKSIPQIKYPQKGYCLSLSLNYSSSHFHCCFYLHIFSFSCIKFHFDNSNNNNKNISCNLYVYINICYHILLWGDTCYGKSSYFLGPGIVRVLVISTNYHCDKI